MASIEVSLGWKRRREALLETLPRAARDLVRELDALHQALRDKDTVIQSLKTQITNLGGTVGGGGEGGGALTETERRSVQDRLAKVQSELDSKRVTVKNLKLSLEKIDITDNIDVRIRAAELEYELEREELNILNLKEEANVLNTRLQENTPSPATNGTPGKNSSFHSLLTSAGGAAALGGASLLSLSVPHTPGNPPFHVTQRPPLGCVIDWATDDTRLKKGDRLVEVNGESVVGCGLEQVTRIMAGATLLNLVVARPITGTGGRKSEDRGKEVKELSAKLDKTIKEKDSYKSDNTRLSHRISYLEEQVLELQNTLSRTRESGRTPAEGEAIVTTSHQPGATVIQVFQKGEQRLAVASPELGNGELEHAQQYPTLPRIRSPDSSLSSPTSCSSSSSSTSSDPHHSHQHSTKGQGVSSKPPNTEHHKRVLSPRPESKNEDSRPPSRTKPIPPKKPERLSLQRTTSLQNVEETPTNVSLPSRSTSTTSTSRHHHPLQAWPSLDTDIHCQERDLSSQVLCDRGRERPDYHSHESIYEKQQELPPPDYSSSWGHEHHLCSSSGGNGGGGDGSVMMVVSASPIVTGEPLSRRPTPQGASATTVTTTTTTLNDRPRLHHHHYNRQQPSTRRPLSPDASYHLDSHIPGGHEDAREIYSHTTTTTHYSAAANHSHHHRSSHLHHHDHNSHQRVSTLSHHSHYTLHSPPTPVASRNSTTLTMAASPRPHEQWC